MPAAVLNISIESCGEDEVRDCARGNGRVHDERIWRAADQADRRKTGYGVVAELLVERRTDGERCDVAGEDRVAVGCRAGRDLSADGPSRTAPVIDDDLLAERVAQRGGYDPRDDVGRAARRERHDIAQRPVREIVICGLRQRINGRDCQQRRS
jgi:hypothetical protein